MKRVREGQSNKAQFSSNDFLKWWTLVTAVGWWGVRLHDLLLLAREQQNGGDVLAVIGNTITGIIYGLFIGLILGYGQQTVLRHCGYRKNSWYWLTFAAMAFGSGVAGYISLYLAIYLNLDNNEIVSWMVAGTIIQAIIGLIVSICQSFALLRFRRYVWLWILASTFIWGCSGAVYWGVYWVMGGPLTFSWSTRVNEPWPGDWVYWQATISAWVIAGLLVGAVTAGLFYVMFKSAKESSDVVTA